MTDHLTWETLNDYADGALDPASRAVAATHLDGCGECRETLGRLRQLLAAAQSGTDTPAPAHAWGSIRREIDRRKDVRLPGYTAPRTRGRFTLAAAAVALVVASSALTATIMRMNIVKGAQVAATDTSASTVHAVALPADVASVEVSYLATARELQSALDASRDRLAPETVHAVERSLAIVDAAIAEVRAALLADPASGLLRDILTKNYQQKIDLLRRASERAQTT